MSAKPAPPADRSAVGNPPEHLTDIYLFDLQKWGDEFSPLILKMPSRFPNDVFGELRFSFDGRWLIATGAMQQGYCWDLRADDIGNSRQPLRGPRPSVQAMLPDTREWLSPTARWGIKPTTAAEKYSLELIDFATDRPGTPTETLVADLPVRFHVKPLFSPQERFCAFSSGGVGHESDLLLFELEAGPNSPRRLYLPGNERTWNNPLGFSPDERWLLYTSTSMNEPMWNIATGRELPSRTILPSIQPFRIVLWSTSLQAPSGKGIELFRGESSSIVTAKFEFCPNNRWLYLVCSSFPEGAYFPEPTREKLQPQFLRADGQPLTQSDFIYELVRFDLTHDDIAASKHVVCKSALRSLISSADGSWVAAGIKDVVQVWKTDQPANDKPWKTLTGNDNLGTHLYRAPHPQKLVSRSYVPEASNDDKKEKREVPKEQENAKGQCLLWDLSSTSEQPVVEFQSTSRLQDNEPLASSDYRWWVSGAEGLDLSTIGPSGPSRMRYNMSDLTQPQLGGIDANDNSPRSAFILRDRWLLARRRPSKNESHPFRLYELGATPRPLEPRMLASSDASTAPSQQFGMTISPAGRWVAEIEMSQDGLTKEARIRLARYGLPTNVEHLINQELTSHGDILKVAFSHAGSYLAIAFREFTEAKLRVWRVSTGQLVREFPAGKDRVLDLCWAPTGNELRWITRNGEVVTGNLADGTLATELIPDDETPFAVFSDSVLTIQPHRSSPLNPESTRELLIQRGLKVNEKLAALKEKDWHFRFWSDSPKQPLDYPQSVIARADWLLFDKQAEAWNPGTGERVSLFHEPHNKSVALATRRPAWANGSLVGSTLSPDETLSSAGESILLYSFAEKRIVHSFTGHTGTITCLAFTPDSRQIVSASADGTARVWQLPTAGGKD
jgi:WD40 repeat protein